jgi:hypothetical protein
MRQLVIVALLILVMSVDDHLDQLARSGNIDESAPVRVSLEITINAAPEKVWGLLTDVKSWPRWQRDISKANISGALQSGTAFSWTAGVNIQSRIALVQPLEQFAWTGTAYKAKAIHVWKLQRLPGDRTLVKTNESMEGFLLTLFYSSSKLKESDQRWLNYLKSAAEQ